VDVNLFLACRKDNDLYGVLKANGVPCRRFVSPSRAVQAAPEGAGVMVLADGYPQVATPIPRGLYAAAAKKKQRMYVEFPAALPGAAMAAPRETTWERAVVASDAFAPGLERLRIVAIHGCRFVPAHAENPHLVVARVAGFDHAVYGLPPEVFPILYEHECGSLLVSTTKLSQFVTARYAPVEAWRTVWQWILGWVTGQTPAAALNWIPSVRPAYGSNDALPEEVEMQAFRRGAEWFWKSKLFVHPDWEKSVQRRLGRCAAEPDSPDALRLEAPVECPVGDGSHGMLEGASAKIHADGSQDWSGSLRNDCIGEGSMAMAFSGTISRRAEDLAVAANLSDYIYFTSPIAQGPRADPASADYGLLHWFAALGSQGVYYGDDNARSMLGTIATSALLRADRWDEGLLKCMLANLRTTGPLGFRSDRLDQQPLQANGWRHYWTDARTHFAPHYESWLWACLLWAYARTGFEPFLERPRTAIRLTMEAYPHQWRWTNGIQQERGRMLLPLAWLVRADDTDEHRQWLRSMAQDLLNGQDACGAIQEEVGSPGTGRYEPPRSNEEYGTREAPLIQTNGDPACDLLYTTNFAFVGLHEAAAATGEPLYAEAEERLAKFLCRIQVRSERHPELDGAWFRAFDFRRWEYWASSADLGWGAWSIESGWTQAWITSILALRHMGTSLWELTASSAIRKHLRELVAVMLPECLPPAAAA